MTRPVKALILDADGVTQTPKLSSITGWLALGGPGLLPALSRAEKPTLTGGVEFEPLIAEVLAERGLDPDRYRDALPGLDTGLDPEVGDQARPK